MSRAISRDSFNELKNYLGVYLQQGRVILDSDWNENQDIAVSFVRRLSRESLGEGSPNRGFAIDPVFPPPPALVSANLPTQNVDLSQSFGQIIAGCLADVLSLMLYMIFGPLLFFLNFPGKKLDDFETLDGFALSSPQGKLRIGRDRPYEGKGFLRLSGHPGTVQITKTLANLTDLSSFEMATFHYRQNQQTPGTMKFFVEDDAANRSVWLYSNPAFGKEMWMAAFAAPLDIRFRITTTDLQPAVQGQSYSVTLFTFGGVTPMTWTVSAGALPTGLTLVPSGAGNGSKTARFSGQTTAQGTFTFTVKVTDAGNKTATRSYTLKVNPPGSPNPFPFPSPADLLGQMGKVETPTGAPADLTRIRKYGFELYQDPNNPLVWDLDDLRLGSTALESTLGNNNFIIRGSEFSQFLTQITLLTIFQNANVTGGGTGGGGGGGGAGSNPFQNILDLLNTNFQLSEPSIENAGRLYVAGFPCVQIHDALYSDQADPNDPPLTPPSPGSIRKDTVYLDVWQEPVTYIEDPEIREIALGGPDTSTRLRVRYRVRVNQGGTLPAGNGIGLGTLETEGVYTGQANRFYLIEIDTPGDIGKATFRWSEDNASTIQRVIEAIQPGSTTVTVEDASAYHPGDLILIRKEFGYEEHKIVSVFANVITLQSPAGAQLAQLPAANRVPNFTTFSLDDRPKIQRWNAFGVTIQADPNDATISSAIPLNDGVQVRFGGRGMLKGDYWNFKTRYLAGDEVSGINPETRIEQLDFQHARGVVHRYAPLATLTRDGDQADPNQIFLIQDRRQRVGNASTVNASLKDLTALTGKALTYLGGVPLLPSALDSKFVVFWSADLFLPAAAPARSNLSVQVTFYNDDMSKDLARDQKSGKIQDRVVKVPLERKPSKVEAPLHLIFAKSDTSFLFLPATSVPTSVQVFVSLDTDGFTVQLSNMQLNVMELKKSF